ncbi:MAG: hypothetical protein LUC93_05100 [Planctomycetaceae bacterium]|nr:hypothetical protein [Planctomycetaceae bacterium]
MTQHTAQYLMGLDVGTTNLKALIFDIDGYERAGAITPTPITTLSEGGAYYDPAVLWASVCRIIGEALANLADVVPGAGPTDLKGIAVASMGEAGVPLDKDGRELYPIIAWYDPRSEAEAQWWRDSHHEDLVMAVSGQKVQHIFSANKLMWLRRHEPAVYDRLDKWACVADYIAFKLSGELAMDYSIASRTMLLDLEKSAWSERLLQVAGIDKWFLPPLRKSGTLVGNVTAATAERTGLDTSTRVFTGGHDHVCGALAVGATRSGIVLDSSGTAEAVLTTAKGIASGLDLSRKGFSVGNHTAMGKYYTYGAMPSSGGTVDWSKREFPTDASLSPGAHGLLFLPHLRGSASPTRNAVSKGSFLGIRAYHTTADFRQAVLDGLCFELREITEALLGDEPIRKFIAIGGGTKNDHWLQTKANVLQASIEVPAVQESTAFGAALLAGIGLGLYQDVDDAVARTYRIGKTAEPDAATEGLYEELYRVYQQLYQTLLPVNTRLETVAVAP